MRIEMRVLKALLLWGGFIFLVVFTAMESTAHAQEIKVTTMLRGGYMGQQGSIFADKKVSQTAACVNFEVGLYSCGWVSFGFDNKKGPDGNDYSQEFDTAVGFTEMRTHFWYLIEAQHYAVHGIDVVNGNFEIGKNIFFARLEAYSPVHRGGPDKGLISSAGVRLDPLTPIRKADRFKLDLGGWLKHDTGSFGFNEAQLAQGSVSASFRITPNQESGWRVEALDPLQQPR